MLRKLRPLVLLAIACVAVLMVREHPFFSLMRLDDALDRRALVDVERYIDLDAVAASTVRVLAAQTKLAAGVGGADRGSKVASAVVDAIGALAGAASAEVGADVLRSAVTEGRVARGLGPFVVDSGWRAFGDVQHLGDTALVTLHGHCGQNAANLRVVMNRRENGPFFGHPNDWKIVGVDDVGIEALAQACRER